MIRKLLPLILALVGLAAGAGAGFVLRPSVDHAEVPTDHVPDDHVATDGHDTTQTDFVKLNNQFVIPVVENGRVSALVVLALNLEVTPGGSEAVYLKEPKLRDALLQVMFDHANAGGFRGVFTDGANLVVLRDVLRETAQKVLGDMVLDVLISDIARQDN